MDDAGADELTALIHEIQARVRARHPNGVQPDGIVLPDLMPLVCARDAAEARVASIGTVNPRPPGLKNSLIQRVKRLIARALDWHVRDQVEFNRGVMMCVEASLAALTETNRSLVELQARQQVRATEMEVRISELRGFAEKLAGEARLLADVRTHWAAWRLEWEEKLFQNESLFLRDMAESHASFQHRVTMLEASCRDLTKAQHSDFTNAVARQHAEFTLELDRRYSEFTDALERAAADIQKRLWDDLARVRTEQEAVIQRELRTIRRRGVSVAPTAASPAPAMPENVDWLAFAERFRGSEEHVRAKQQIYGASFAACTSVLDLGCGRGEMLEILRDAGIPALGIDGSSECVGVCERKGLAVEKADLFDFLANSTDTFDGIVSAQVIEHLPAMRLPELIRLAHARLRPGGKIAFETPNPECLAIFATHFWLDPTHTRPVPPALLGFWLEEAGFGALEVKYLHPAADSIPELCELSEGLRKALFGGLDYVMFAQRLSS